ncbi:hypothetical protein MNEG_9641 [Monoraphidium neglectum]|uniref:DUF2177 family protein n=1 Tax=Monoraphidium neglectum TaxID=145388 RepID=A0A0D2JFS5_9CHLO|nr:hypothetical protein MNEG_9641 [Monoraphidium neglectum]KIY98322.1 hypothetical protein MNEG_9641 [Monoraphidium neglectum]|eukprot:XP_013897342.1 hypothetical protein MNEG_9641 [Monoraphidium neglectum]
MYSPLSRAGGPSQPGLPGRALASLKALGLVFLPSFVAFVILDVIWITYVAKDVYAGLKPILKEDPDPVAAVLSWIAIVMGAYVFVLPRTGGGRTAWHVVGQGALFGLLLYGTVDLTNCALLTAWGWNVALVDMAWGTLACAVLSLTQRSLASYFPSLGL